MSEITWIKLKTDMFDNQKIRLIEALPEGDTILVIWIKLLTYAGRTNANGFILINEDIALTIEEMAIIFNRQLNIVRLALEAFKRYGMISMHNDIVRIKNWEVHQNIEGMERAKQLNAERNRKYRERKKLELPMVAQERDVSVTSHDATDIDLELELEEEIDKEIDKDNKPSRQKRVFDNNSDEMKLVEFFISEIRKNSEGFKTPNKQNWCDEFRKIIELDKRDKGEVSKLIRWVQTDDFEKANVLSPSKLRKRYDALKIKMLNPPKQKQSREKVPDWFGKKDEPQSAPVEEDPTIAAERERLRQELMGGRTE